MFDQETWHNQIVERLNTFARNPWQDIQLSGARTVFGYLALRTLEPFLEAFQREPVNAVLALASIAQGSGADYIVRQATRMRFQGGRVLERELPSNPDLCATVEHLMVDLNVVHMVRQRLNSTRDDWLRHTLMKELETLGPTLFVRIRNLLEDPGWKLRLGAILNLKHSQGNFTPAELILLSEGLKDSSAEVRSAAARRLGDFARTPPVQLVKTLVHVSLHDCDMKTRRVAARALGGLRNRIASPEVLTLLVQHLSDGDCFVRSAAVMLLIELGEMAGIPPIIERLIWLLKDSDPYVREAAALALGHMGKSALTSEVMEALTEAGADSDSAVHEAAVESLIQLRKLRGPHSTAHHPHQETSLPSPSPQRAGPTEVLHSREAGQSSVSPPSRQGGTTDNLSAPPSGIVEKNGHMLRRL